MLVQAVPEETPRPPTTGPVGLACMESVSRAGSPDKDGGSGECGVGRGATPRATGLGPLVTPPTAPQRYTALAAHEARHPATYGVLGAAVCRQECAYTLAPASTKTELSPSPLQALITGATWTVLCRPPKTETHLLGDCPRWQAQRAPWLLLVLVDAAPLPTVALPST